MKAEYQEATARYKGLVNPKLVFDAGRSCTIMTLLSLITHCTTFSLLSPLFRFCAFSNTELLHIQEVLDAEESRQNKRKHETHPHDSFVVSLQSS